MNSAMPWNVNGVGFDAREAAREAARRQGKSLGEWLHGVIADHADHHGLAPREIGGQDRIDAVTARLEQMGARAGIDHGRRPARQRQDARSDPRADARSPSRRPADPRDTYDDGERYQQRAASGRSRRAERDDDDGFEQSRRDESQRDQNLLDQAIAGLERRADRAERRTDQALASVARLLEETQARREQEYENVSALTRKLGELETNLATRFADGEGSPIKGSLARLEARLDAIGRRGAAEDGARRSAERAPAQVQAQASETVEPIRRLEDKLNTILEAMAPRREAASGASAPAIAAVHASAPAGRRSLGDAIADISRRQRALDGEPQAAARAAARAEPPPQAPARETAYAALQVEMAGLVAKVEEMRRDALLSRQARPAPRDGDIEAMRGEIGAMSHMLGELAQRDTVAALESSIGALAERIDASRDGGMREGALRPVETAVNELRRSLHALDPRETIGGLEEQLRRLGDKVERLESGDGLGIERLRQQMEAVRQTVDAANARTVPLERLESQVAALAERIDRRLAEPRDDSAARQHAVSVERQLEALRRSFEAAGARTVPVERIETQVAALAERIDRRLAEPRADEAAHRHATTIEQRLDVLASRLDAALSAGRPAEPADTGRLEALVTGLGARLEAAQAPGADKAVLDALQRQVEDLARRLENSQGELPGLGASMRELFAQMDATRTSIESTASQAAREVLKIAAGAERAPRPAPEPPARDGSLDTMQDMLGKVVDRLAGMEREIADVRPPVPPVAASAPVPPRAPTPAPAAPRKPSAVRPVIGTPAPDIRLGGAEPRQDARREPRMTPAAKPRQGEAANAPIIVPPPDPRGVVTEDGRRADFIAAARRAAATAQAETAAAQRPAEAARAGLLARSRDYVATNRRPMLMGLAAVLMALGTLALVGRANLFDVGVQIAAVPTPPAKVAAAVPSTPVPAPIASAAAPSMDVAAAPATQKAAPALGNPIPGSDPIQTGSIPSLPSFAASAPPPRPVLPQGLVAAAENGDAAAQYMLGTQYADGRVLPRDVRAAIGWFEKAAAAGSAPAEYRLGLTYEKGLGVPADKAKAKGFYVKAADAGNPRAMHNLAVMLADGDGHPDYAGAVSWFRKAAQLGVHDSQYNLAVLLGRGLGVPQNLTQSYQWFATAAAAGDVDAGKKRDEVAVKLSANDLAVAKALAASFQPKVPDPSAVEIATPPGGWDGAPGASRINSAKTKISAL